MLCSRCGADNPSGQKFCGNCGSVLTRAPERAFNLTAHLSTLSQAELVREVTRAPELAYLFRHALTQEAAYNSLLVKQRREIHRRVGDAIEQLYAGRLDEFAPMLAPHFFSGEDWARAATYAMRAGDGALRVFALREAMGHYERALDARAKMDEAPPEQFIDATLGWMQGALKFKPYDELIARLGRAEQLARARDDKRRLARILHWTANAHFANGSTARAAPALFENFQMASELGDERLSIVPSYYMAFFMVDRDPRGALAQLDQVIEMARRLGNGDVEAHAIATKAFAHARLGEFALARAEAERALEYTGRRTSPIPEADLYNMAGFVYLDMGDAERALEYRRRGVEKALAANAIECAAAGHLCVGMSQLQRQNVPEAQTAFTETIRLAEFSGSEPFRNSGQGGLAMAQFFGGRADAIRGIEAALDNARAIDDPYMAAMFSQTLAEIDLHGGDIARAENYLNSALDYYRRNAMRPYLARALQSLAQLYDHAGRTDDARRADAEAQALLTECQ